MYNIQQQSSTRQQKVFEHRVCNAMGEWFPYYIYLFRSFDSETDIFSKPNRVRKQIKMNLVQLKMDWISLPNIRNGAYLGKDNTRIN